MAERKSGKRRRGQAGPGRARRGRRAGAPRPCVPRDDRGKSGDRYVPVTDTGAARIHPNKNRDLQIARTGGRKLFDRAAQKVFLEWFAATCNFSWSAELAGFNYKTVMRHRMNDPVFAEGCDRAMRQAYARIEAKRLETKRKELPIGIEGDRDAPEMDDMTPERMDAILRDYRRAIAGVKKPGLAPRAASNAEVRAALIKRLKAFGIRVSAAEEEEADGEQDEEEGPDAPRDDGAGEADGSVTGNGSVTGTYLSPDQAEGEDTGEDAPPPSAFGGRSPSPGKPGEDL